MSNSWPIYPKGYIFHLYFYSNIFSLCFQLSILPFVHAESSIQAAEGEEGVAGLRDGLNEGRREAGESETAVAEEELTAEEETVVAEERAEETEEEMAARWRRWRR